MRKRESSESNNRFEGSGKKRTASLWSPTVRDGYLSSTCHIGFEITAVRLPTHCPRIFAASCLDVKFLSAWPPTHDLSAWVLPSGNRRVPQ